MRLIPQFFIIGLFAFSASAAQYSGIDASKIRGFTCYNNVTAADVDSVVAWGGNTLRIMLMIHDLHDLRGYDILPSSKIIPAKMEKLVKVVDLCRERGMLAIIDYHETPGLVRFSGWKDFRLWQTDRVGEGFQDLVVDTWCQLAEKFKDYPVNSVAYELFNEPEPKWNDWNAPEDQGHVWDSLQSRLIREIRKIDRKHTLIGSPPYGWRVCAIDPDPYILRGANFDGWSPSPEVINDDKIILTVHMYHPHDYTIQWGPWADTSVRAKGYPGKFSGDIWEEAYWDKERLRWSLKPIARFQKKYPQIPVVITEFTTIRIAPGAATYLADVISLFKKMKLGWTYHAYKERGYLADKKGCDDTMWDLEPSEIPDEGRRAVTDDPYDRLKVIKASFKN